LLDTDFLTLCLIASLVYNGDVWAACEASQRFQETAHVNTINLKRILSHGFESNERTFSWLVGSRRLPVSEFTAEVAASGRVPADIRAGWAKSVLIRRSYL
jgi:putative lipase involved disintegration of autophagic bodies